MNSLIKALPDGTLVERITNIPMVEVLEVGTDPHGFWTYTKNTMVEYDNKKYAYLWEYEQWLRIKQEEDYRGFYLNQEEMYIEGIIS